MLIQLSLFVVGFWSIRSYAESSSTYTGCPGIVYIKPDDSRNWTEAQETCRQLNSTLPIIDTLEKQSCFTNCLQHFNLNPNSQVYVWIGANSSWSNQWKWLNENNYSIAAIQMDNTYSRSYAFAAKDSNSSFFINSSVPTDKLFYVCCYKNPGNSNCINGSNHTVYVGNNSCFVSYKETLSWFRARNQCLLKGGDLATLSNVSLLNEIIQNGKWWIGLRSSRWNWIESGKTRDVTFTQWEDSQPNGAFSPQCISTVESDSSKYFSWRDWNCNDSLLFLCEIQIHNEISTLDPISISQITTTSAYAVKDSSTKDTRNLVLGVGIGVGIGVPVMLALIALIVLLAVRHRRRTTNSREPRSGSYPGVTQPSSSDSPYGVVAMATIASSNSASEEYNGNTTSKAQIEYATLQIVPKSSSQHHFDSGDNDDTVYSNSSQQTPPVADTAHYGVVNKGASRI